MNYQIEKSIKVGDKVVFDNLKTELFKLETNLENIKIQQYRNLILAGIDQVGIVKAIGVTRTTTTYPDGWELPIPTKYLTVLPDV